MDKSPAGTVPTVAHWKGKQISKMSRADLEAEFLGLAMAEMDRLKSPHLPPPAGTAKPPLDPQTARCLAELRAVIRAVEAGEAGMTRFDDSLIGEDGLHRSLGLRVTYHPPKAKGAT